MEIQLASKLIYKLCIINVNLKYLVPWKNYMRKNNGHFCEFVFIRSWKWYSTIYFIYRTIMLLLFIYVHVLFITFCLPNLNRYAGKYKLHSSKINRWKNQPERIVPANHVWMTLKLRRSVDEAHKDDPRKVSS